MLIFQIVCMWVYAYVISMGALGGQEHQILG